MNIWYYSSTTYKAGRHPECSELQVVVLLLLLLLTIRPEALAFLTVKGNQISLSDFIVVVLLLLVVPRLRLRRVE
jgi:hypothetical protein